MSVDGPAVPEDPTGYRKQAIRLADERELEALAVVERILPDDGCGAR
jgi:hypothetical protein